MEHNQEKQDKKPAVIPPDERSKKDTIKKNPNPRANANIPEGKDKDNRQTEGVGSEITDGEAG